MTRENAEYSAASLYDGDWRASDRDYMKDFYNLTDEEADELCEELQKLEDLEKENEE